MSKVCPNCGTQFSDVIAVCPTDGATLRAADPGNDFIGSIVADRYVVTESLGEGGMGKVYRARHVRLPREAAIKVLHPHMVQDPAAIARFDREAANASRIDHDNVVRVFDFGETSDGLVYLAMEFVPGRTLKDVLTEDGPLTMARAADVVRQVAAGLDAAHRLGIVHRDLKPDNVLVLHDTDGTLRCKIADFGIAKAIGSGEKSLTRTGFVIGTPEYMSPEQLLGGEIDHRSDVYALALLAYQCLTGETPFDSKTPDRGMMARLTNSPRELAELRPDQSWPKDLQAVLNKGLDRESVRRYESAGHFAASFERALTSPLVSREARAISTPIVTAPRTPAAAQAVPLIEVPAAAPRVRHATPPRSVAPVAARVADTVPPPPPVRSRRRFSLPHIPIVRWTVTAAFLAFGWLVITEGSIARATRRAGVLARSAEASLKRLAGGSSSGTTRKKPAAATSNSNGAAAPLDSAVDAPPDTVAPPKPDSAAAVTRDTSVAQTDIR